MERIAEIIHKIYQKYLPIASKVGVSLNLDFPDTTISINEKAKREQLEKDLDKNLKSALERTRQGSINVSVRKDKIIVTDTGTVLSKTACKILSGDRIKVKSRVGFGTEVSIILQD